MKNLAFVLAFSVCLIACSPGTPSASSDEVQGLVIELVKESFQDALTRGHADDYNVEGVDDITYKAISDIGGKSAKEILDLVDEDLKDIKFKLGSIVLVETDDDLKFIRAKATVLGTDDPFDITYTAQRTEEGNIRVEVY